MDVAARVLAESLDKSLGQRLVIENRAGSGGNIGTEAVVKADPDGYTLGQIQLGNVAINPYVYPDMGFDPLTDLQPVAPVTTSAILIVANAKLPVNNLTELIALAKKEPGKLSYGSAGNGTAPHLAGEMFKAAAGVDILHVPYRGAGPAVNDTIGGHVQLTFVGLGAVRSGVDAGLLKILAVAQPTRLKDAPQYPTAAEAGLPGYEFVDLVRSGRAEGHATADHRQAREAHPHDGGRSGGTETLRRRRPGGREGNARAVRRPHASRLRSLPRYRQGGKAQAGVSAAPWRVLAKSSSSAAASPG